MMKADKHVAIIHELLIFEHECDYAAIWLVPDYYNDDLEGERYISDPKAKRIIDKLPTQEAFEVCDRMKDVFESMGISCEIVGESDI
ncbi:hypothetical protein JD969_14545 [Planctomycetota bacterium]|nr:hypothetical protein JD969_14545 [Planctomycetota bacterium]